MHRQHVLTRLSRVPQLPPLLSPIGIKRANSPAIPPRYVVNRQLDQKQKGRSRHPLLAACLKGDKLHCPLVAPQPRITSRPLSKLNRKHSGLPRSQMPTRYQIEPEPVRHDKKNRGRQNSKQSRQGKFVFHQEPSEKRRCPTRKLDSQRQPRMLRTVVR